MSYVTVGEYTTVGASDQKQSASKASVEEKKMAQHDIAMAIDLLERIYEANGRRALVDAVSTIRKLVPTSTRSSSNLAIDPRLTAYKPS